MKVEIAVFPVAGFGTRFLPATKSVPKELLPIVDRPALHYAVDEAIVAGATLLIFITGRNKRAIEDYFDFNKELDSELRAKGKTEIADKLASIVPDGVQCVFVRQHEQLGLGHAVMCAKRLVGEKPFMVSLADDFLIENPRSQLVLKEMVKAYNHSNKSQLCTMRVGDSEISKYGVVGLKNGTRQVTQVVEKPSLENAPSDNAVIGRYVLDPKIFSYLENLEPGAGGEIQLTDAINQLAKDDCVEAVSLLGERYDCGSVQGYANAIMRVCDRRKRIKRD